MNIYFVSLFCISFMFEREYQYLLHTKLKYSYESVECFDRTSGRFQGTRAPAPVSRADHRGVPSDGGQ